MNPYTCLTCRRVLLRQSAVRYNSSSSSPPNLRSVIKRVPGGRPVKRAKKLKLPKPDSIVLPLRPPPTTPLPPTAPEFQLDHPDSIWKVPSTSDPTTPINFDRKIPTMVIPRQARKHAMKKAKRGIRVNRSVQALSKLSLRDYNNYWDTLVPDKYQLEFADEVFQASRHSPVRMWSASEFRTIPMSSVPEVAFFGRSNVGKSSLLNNIMNDEVCFTSSKPGRTRELNAFGIGGTKGGDAKVVLIDTPGYGKGSQLEWGEEIMKYFTQRKQLRRAFLLVDPRHGLKPYDRNILTLFRRYNISHQIILPKVDKVIVSGNLTNMRGYSDEKLKKLQSRMSLIKAEAQPPVLERGEGPGVLGELLSCSARLEVGGTLGLGIDAVRWAILKACGLDALAKKKSRLEDNEGPINPVIRRVRVIDSLKNRDI
ncbi:ribosome biogenesis GTP-binding protein YsxC [Polytolypa hystricis UAMH7299]|uniref:GTP-binding protein 8 n=1 Tax=Polytolypa hystricis (strain UAMH7299) TaxID=1447883 RepID=A0A2B7X1J4_POLH7|nr:ribosome biogenesis GTP-binding protein YsxC [Polytolypa hystricis UAMH7299]